MWPVLPACFYIHSVSIYGGLFCGLCTLLGTSKNDLKDREGYYLVPDLDPGLLSENKRLSSLAVFNNIVERTGPHSKPNVILKLCCFHDSTTTWYSLVIFSSLLLCVFAQPLYD